MGIQLRHRVYSRDTSEWAKWETLICKHHLHCLGLLAAYVWTNEHSRRRNPLRPYLRIYFEMSFYQWHRRNPDCPERPCTWLKTFLVVLIKFIDRCMYEPNSRKILGTSTPHHHHTMLLQSMTLARDVSMHALPRAQFNSSNLPLRWIGFLWLHNKYLTDYSFPLRVSL